MSEPLKLTVDKFTFRVPTDRLYTAEGLWCLPVEGSAGKQHVRVGLTDYLQQHSGDIAFASPKPAGTQVSPSDCMAEIETIKTILELTAPVRGVVAAVNEALKAEPFLVNDSPYDKGWLLDIEATNWDADRASLLRAANYFAAMESLVQKELKGS